MAVRARFGFAAALAALLAFPGLSAAQGARSVATTQDADYFGFDLRTEREVTLDQCTATCLADPQCRAFTYNTRAEWCFLKSDYSTLNPFTGAVAGKVVDLAGEPDIGAPPELAFLPAEMADEARRYRAGLTAGIATGEAGVVFLISAADGAAASGDPRGAMRDYAAALAVEPEDAGLWLKLARAVLAVEPSGWDETSRMPVAATSAAFTAYRLSRTTATRAGALAALAAGLDRREIYRPALQAYDASLALADSAEVRAARADLRQRRGFRITDHTVESDLASPRICAQFSEDLVRSGTDYASFVTVDGAAPRAVEARERQICVEGLEHGRQYAVAFRAGLPSTVGEVIEAPVLLTVYVRDRAPSARFTGDSFVLPATARRGIPLVSVNMDVADVKLFRIGDRALAQLLSGYQFLRQLDGYDVENIAGNLGTPVWEGQIEIEAELNQEVVTSFPVDEALPGRTPGVYVLTATPENDTSETWEGRATQWFVVSDIGLATYAGEDGLAVFARSLSTAMPLAGVELQLLARNNEVLGTAATDADGRATFTAGLVRGTGGLVPAAVTARDAGGEDFVFLDMTRAGFDLSDRGVTGRAAPGALDVYGWTERGIYRVGETVHGAALARDDTAEAVENLPLTFVFMRPDGVEDRRIVSDGAALGGHAVAFDIQENAMRGAWQMRIHADPAQAPVAQAGFLVEDFVPDRIEFDLAADAPEIAPGGTVEIAVDGRFLYGAPAAGLVMEGEVNIGARREWARFPGYQFGLADEDDQEAVTQQPLAGLPVLGEAGEARFEVGLQMLPSTTRLLNAELAVRLREGGGRAVERRLDLPVAPETAMIGIRPEFSGGSVPENTNAAFRVIAAAPDGARTAIDGAEWTLVKVERNYQWYRQHNSWNYEPVTYTSNVAEGVVDIAADSEARISVPVGWGRYRLEIVTDDPLGPATSVEFDAGFYVEASSTETPDGLEIALDRESYAPGDVARLQVSPRFAGELLVTVGSERLITTLTASVPEEGATVDIPVTEDWGGGAYVTATLYRPGDAEETRMPMRAIGLKWAAVEPGARALSVDLEVPEESAPRAPLVIPVSVSGAEAGETAYVTVAAVDVGILNLTRYEAPDPVDWYFGQRRLGIEMRDLYGRLIDGSLGAAGRLRTGGDGGGLVAAGSPPTERLVAFFSGPVALDAEGRAEIAFDIPQFNGTARVMAVAWTKRAVGHAKKDVVVRDPVVVTASHPRFMAPGDTAELRLDIANAAGPAGDYTVTVEGGGAVAADTASVPAVTLAEGGRKTVIVPLSATATGDGRLSVRLAHADGVSVEQALSIPVRPAAMPMATRLVVDLAPGASLRVDGGLLAASLLDGASVSIGVSPASAFDIPSLLMTLDRYPYGCAEQITSRALPLLYVSELGRAAGMADDPALGERIEEAIARVLSFQSSAGSFGLWSPGYGDLWLDAYVTDFLTRAREEGHEVPREAMLKALENLTNSLAYDVDLTSRSSEIAYALYVLARNRKASVGDLRYYADTQIDQFATPMARAQIGAALALYGDSRRADSAFGAALRLARSQQADGNLWRADYGSALRDGAAMLALAAETRPAPTLMPQMVDLVAAERPRATHTSTQEEAWMLLAARAVEADADAISLTVNGAEHSGAFSERLEGSELLDRPVTLVNRGDAAVEAVVTTVAAPADPLPAGGDGFSIERAYYTLDGSPASVMEAAQNERFVVVLNLTEFNEWPSRVLVTDLLPAGFEIDNPRLVSSADLAAFEWLGETEAAHVEFRDDRFVAAFDRTADSDRAMVLAYVVRAVTPGTYAHPAAQVEDMYRPQFNARTAAGMMAVTAP